MNAISSECFNELDPSSLPCNYLAIFYSRTGRGGLTSHQMHCLECAEWLYTNHRDRFEYVLDKAKTSRRGNLRILNLAEDRGYQTKNSYASINAVDILLANIVRSCRAYKLPNELSDLPDIPGVYILATNANSKTKIIYIGKSVKSLRHRWAKHHRWGEIQVLLNADIEVNMYCLLFPAEGSEDLIDRTEKDLITRLSPAFNNKPVVDLSDSEFV